MLNLRKIKAKSQAGYSAYLKRHVVHTRYYRQVRNFHSLLFLKKGKSLQINHKEFGEGEHK